jgi:hypothetical protein
MTADLGWTKAKDLSLLRSVQPPFLHFSRFITTLYTVDTVTYTTPAYRSTMEEVPPKSILLALAQHVSLPPQLPQQADSNDLERTMGVWLCRLVVFAIKKFCKDQSDVDREVWSRLSAMVEFLGSTVELPLERQSLSKGFASLEPGGAFQLHVFRCTCSNFSRG